MHGGAVHHVLFGSGGANCMLGMRHCRATSVREVASHDRCVAGLRFPECMGAPSTMCSLGQVARTECWEYGIAGRLVCRKLPRSHDRRVGAVAGRASIAMAVGGAANRLPLGGFCRAFSPIRVKLFKKLFDFCQRTCQSRSLMPVCASSTPKNAVDFSQFKFYATAHRQQLTKLDLGAYKGERGAVDQIQSRTMFMGGQEYRTQPMTTISDNQHYTVVYRFQGIRFLSAISKLKIIQTGLTVVLVPTVYLFYLQNLIQYSLVCNVTGLSGFAVVMLYSMSYYLRHFIGMMYLNNSGTTLMVSHLTFWGRRNDFYVPVQDVIPLGDTEDARNDTILQFKRYNSSEVFYFTIKFGQIVDKQKFLQVFGGIH